MKTTKSGKVILSRLQNFFADVSEAREYLRLANKQIRQEKLYGCFRYFSLISILVFMYLLVFCSGIILGTTLHNQKKEIHIKTVCVKTLPETGVGIR